MCLLANVKANAVETCRRSPMCLIANVKANVIGTCRRSPMCLLANVKATTVGTCGMIMNVPAGLCKGDCSRNVCVCAVSYTHLTLPTRRTV